MDKKPLEEKIEVECVDFAETLGVMHLKMDKVNRDWPDQAFFLPRGTIWIVEFKRPGKDARRRQSVIHDRLRRLGFVVDVIDDVSVFRNRLFLRAGLPFPPDSPEAVRRAVECFSSMLSQVP